MTPDDVYQQIVEFAQDPRCDHLMAAGFMMALMEELGDEGWTLIDRELFLSADSGHGEEEHWKVLDSSTVGDQFIYERFFAALQKLPTPVAAAATVAVLVADLVADGQTEIVLELSDRIRSQMKAHMRQM